MANPEEPTEPLLRKADFTSYLEMKAKEMAPRDVEVLLAEIENEGGGALAEPHTRLGRQLILSLELLEDHVRGDCPQIPFYTISLLTEAVYYFLDPNDVIPDWIPGIGKLDDALVMELAFEYGADGIHRYCLWKGIELASLYDPSPDRAAAKTSKKLTDKTSQRRRAARTSEEPAGAEESGWGENIGRVGRQKGACEAGWEESRDEGCGQACQEACQEACREACREACNDVEQEIRQGRWQNGCEEEAPIVIVERPAPFRSIVVSMERPAPSRSIVGWAARWKPRRSPELPCDRNRSL